MLAVGAWVVFLGGLVQAVTSTAAGYRGKHLAEPRPAGSGGAFAGVTHGD